MCEKVNVTLTTREISLPGQVASIKDKYHGSPPKPTNLEEGCSVMELGTVGLHIARSLCSEF